MFIAGEAGIDRAKFLTDNRSMIAVRSTWRIGGGNCDAKRTAALVSDIVRKLATAILHQLRSPEATVSPHWLVVESSSTGRPAGKILGAERRNCGAHSPDIADAQNSSPIWIIEGSG
jgi:hypothetical protein